MSEQITITETPLAEAQPTKSANEHTVDIKSFKTNSFNPLNPHSQATALENPYESQINYFATSIFNKKQEDQNEHLQNAVEDNAEDQVKEEDTQGEEEAEDDDAQHRANEDAQPLPENESSKVSQPARDRLAKEFAKLAQERAALRREQQEIKKIQEERKGLSLEDLKKKAEENPFETLEQLGLDYNSLTKKIIEGEDKPEDRKLSKVEKEIQQLREMYETEQRERLRLQAQTTKQQFRNQVISALDAKQGEYELIKSLGLQDNVVDIIVDAYQSSGKLVSVDEAAKVYENELEKDIFSRIQTLAKTQKAKKWGLNLSDVKEAVSEAVDSLKTSNTTDQAESKEAIPPLRLNEQKANTLTSQMTASSRPTSFGKRRTRDESIANAAKLIRFND